MYDPLPTTRLANCESKVFLEQITQKEFCNGPALFTPAYAEVSCGFEGWVIAHVKIKIRRVSPGVSNLFEVTDSRIYYYGD